MTGHSSDPQVSPSLIPANPFSTRAVRPGALEFRFPPADSLSDLLLRLDDHQGWGQIVGPHGSGKSTLLHTLREALLAGGRTVDLLTLSSGQRKLSLSSQQVSTWGERTQVVVDGFEQLGWRQRWWLKRICRRQGCGLLVTTHAPCGFPVLYETTTSPSLADQLVSTLVAADTSSAESISAADVESAFARHNGNLREVFFELYDRFESAR